MKKITCCSLFLSLFCSISFAERTQEGFYLDQNLGASYNPLGLNATTKFFYRMPVVKSDGVLWESTKLDVGVQNNLSPAYDLIGLFLNFEPIAVFSVALSAQFAAYHELFGFGFYDVDGYLSGFDSNALVSLGTRNAFGHVISAAPTFKFAYGPVAALNTLTLTHFQIYGSDGHFFERMGNTILANSDVELVNQAYVMVTVYDGLRLGVNDSVLYVPGSQYLSHRLAGIAAYSTKLTEDLEIYSALLMGTFLKDAYYYRALYIGGQVGITLKL